MLCKNCGAELADDARFCNKCGNEVSDNQEYVDVQRIFEEKKLLSGQESNEGYVNEYKENNLKTNKNIAIICICVACAILGAIVLIFIVSNANSPVKRGYELYVMQEIDSLDLSEDMSVKEFEKLGLIATVTCVYYEDSYFYKVVYNYGTGTAYFTYHKDDDDITTYSSQTFYNHYYDRYTSGDKDVKYKKVA